MFILWILLVGSGSSVLLFCILIGLMHNGDFFQICRFFQKCRFLEMACALDRVVVPHVKTWPEKNHFCLYVLILCFCIVDTISKHATRVHICGKEILRSLRFRYLCSDRSKIFLFVFFLVLLYFVIKKFYWIKLRFLIFQL